MDFMSNFFNMEENKQYGCGEHIVHRVNNELFVDGELLYTFYTHDSMGNKFKKGPVGKPCRSNKLTLQQIASLVAIMHQEGCHQVQ